jgi:hypothetical protein
MANGATIIRINGTALLSYVSTASKGIPMTKNRKLFVMKPT